MLSSIHPLGERSRNNRWGVTVSAFTFAAVAAGALIGATLGLAGEAALGSWETATRLAVTAAIVAVAGLADSAGVKPPSPTRQVNENWIGHYRGWVYGGAFGIQLGTGFVTFVVTWGVYATLAAELLTASAVSGAVVGAVFGLGRSAALLLAAGIDRPSRLTRFHQRMATLGPLLRQASSIAVLGVGMLTVLAVIT